MNLPEFERNKSSPHSFRPAPLPIVEEGGTLVFQFAKDKGYKDIACSLQNKGCASAMPFKQA